MSAILLLFSIGLLLLAVEVFVPGGILGIFGGLCMAAGCVLSFNRLGSSGGMIAIIAAIGLLGLTLYLEFVVLPKTRLARKFSMGEAISGQSAPPIADRSAVIGREVVALTTLAPSGYVELEGRRYEAFCQSGHAAIGVRLRAVEVDNFRLIVTQIKDSS